MSKNDENITNTTEQYNTAQSPINSTDNLETNSNDNVQKNTLNYEQAREELINIVRTLETGNLSLQQSMQLWEKGEKLVTECKILLENYQKTIDEKLKNTKS